MPERESDPASRSASTLPEEPNRRFAKREKRLNLFGLLLVVLVVLVALSGMVGVRTATSLATSAEYELEVLHSSIARPGLATPFTVTVRVHQGSLPESVTLRIDSTYLAIFDEHGLTPAPTDSFSDSDWTWWTFHPPQGRQEMSVALDARLEPSVQWRREATVALIAGGERKAEVDLVTWVLP